MGDQGKTRGAGDLWSLLSRMSSLGQWFGSKESIGTMRQTVESAENPVEWAKPNGLHRKILVAWHSSCG
jgi:hypothetical protein